MRRLLPVLCLFLLSPLLAEYLSGSLPATMLGILPLMAALYGSGALLVREVARRSGGGWAAIGLLGLAYGLIEEGFVTQSLFNPNYMHLRLLDFGYLPALGIGVPWLVYVLSIHAIWSICVPIAVAEAMFPARRGERWLAWWGIALFALLFLAAAAMIAAFSYKQVPFLASPAQFATTGAAVAALVVAALTARRWQAAAGSAAAPGMLLLFTLGLAGGGGLVLIEHIGPSRLHLPWWACTALLLAVEAGFVAAATVLARGRDWHARHVFAVAAGAYLAYFVSGFFTDRVLHGAADAVPHAIVAVAMLVPLLLAWRASRA